MVIAALVSGADLRARIRDAMRDAAQVHWCVRRDDVPLLLRETWVDALIVEAWDAAGASVAALLAQVRDDFPSLPIVAYCPLTPAAMHEMVLLARAGVDEVLVREHDDVAILMRDVLARARGRRTASELLPELAVDVPADVVSILACCLEQAGRAISVEHVARELGVHRKTLVNRMAAAGWPPPSTIIAWCRLLLAARLLEERGRSVEQVALALDFGSGTALRNMLRRYTQLRPADVRHHGGVRVVLRLFKEQLRTVPDVVTLAS